MTIEEEVRLQAAYKLLITPTCSCARCAWARLLEVARQLRSLLPPGTPPVPEEA